MARINTIHIQNFKTLSDLEMNFDGATAIITGRNNSGKTSFLRGITDRIRFVRPEVLVKKGEKDGRGELILTTGEKFIWEFDVLGKDKLTYVTTEGARRSVTKDLGAQFFPPTFDIDKFLQSPPKKQAEQLQSIIGLDFTDIDQRFDKAYRLRTERNREAELYRVKLEKLIKAPYVKPVDIDELVAKREVEKKRLNDLYAENKKVNRKKREDWEKEKTTIDKEVSEFNELESQKSVTYKMCQQALTVLANAGYMGEEALNFVEGLEAAILPYKSAKDLYPEEPTYIEEMPDRKDLDAIDAEILLANDVNAEARKYSEYMDHKKATDDAREAAEDADRIVKAIEQERLDLIASKNMPEGIEITTDGILVDGFPLDRNQISTSKLYTSALKIASINLGEVRTLYFDASFLDRNTLTEIEQWAHANDLQLLIERPDWEGNEIRYEILETV